MRVFFRLLTIIPSRPQAPQRTMCVCVCVCLHQLETYPALWLWSNQVVRFFFSYSSGDSHCHFWLYLMLPPICQHKPKQLAACLLCYERFFFCTCIIPWNIAECALSINMLKASERGRERRGERERAENKTRKITTTPRLSSLSWCSPPPPLVY